MIYHTIEYLCTFVQQIHVNMNKIAVLIMLVIVNHTLISQTISAGTISSFAGSVSNSTISINYSVGENAISTVSNTSNYVTQGFLQPELSISTGVIEINEKLDISVFPNPCIDFVSIKSINLVSWIVYDSAGKVVLNGNENRVEAEHFALGIYLLEITDKQTSSKKTIKLIKN